MYRVVWSVNDVANEWLIDSLHRANQIAKLLASRHNVNVNVIPYGRDPEMYHDIGGEG